MAGGPEAASFTKAGPVLFAKRAQPNALALGAQLRVA
jgi:hypothetical protein